MVGGEVVVVVVGAHYSSVLGWWRCSSRFVLGCLDQGEMGMSQGAWMRKVPRLSKALGFSCLESNARRRLLKHTTGTQGIILVLLFYPKVAVTYPSHPRHP